MRSSTKLLSLCALTVLAFSACSESSNVGPDYEPGMAVVPVMVSAAPGLSTLVVEVSATDITTPLAYNLTMVDGTASDTITIPAGSDRTITVRGYDSSNIETHRGSTVTNLVEGSNTAVTVTLDPLAGDQPIVVVMGGVTVEISPAVDTVSVGSTIQLTGVVLNDQGDTLEVVPVWSTLNPAVATVDSTGLVTGVSAGSATIVGTYGGVGASANVVALSTPVAFSWLESAVIAAPEVFNELDGSGAADVWTACGYRCIQHFDGNSWSTQSVAFGLNYYGVFSRGASDVYFAGQSGIARWDGAAITEAYSGGPEWIASWFDSELTGFACGDGFLTINGGVGTLVDVSTLGWDRGNDVWSASSGTGYCAGRAGLFAWDGAALTLSNPGSYRGVDGTSDADIWAVGLGGLVTHFDGGGWSTVDAGQGTADVWEVAVLSTTSVFVMHSEAIYEWNGDVWTRHELPVGAGTYATGLYVPTGDDVFVAVVDGVSDQRSIFRGSR